MSRKKIRSHSGEGFLKYFTQTIFDAISFGTANTSGISEQFDLSQISSVWFQVVGTGTSTTTDCSIQFAVSNDRLALDRDDSIWINEGSAATFLQTNFFDKHANVIALKGKVTVTRNSGAAALTIRAVGKPIVVASS